MAFSTGVVMRAQTLDGKQIEIHSFNFAEVGDTTGDIITSLRGPVCVVGGPTLVTANAGEAVVVDEVNLLAAYGESSSAKAIFPANTGAVTLKRTGTATAQLQGFITLIGRS